MDINKIPPSPPKAQAPSKSEPLVALSRLLHMTQGQILSAHISATEPISAAERAELLKQTAAELAQIKAEGKTLTPALKAEVSRLTQQQDLIQSPALKWIKLLVNNRPLLTYSDRPLVAGQTLSVQLQGPHKLVLLDTLNSTAAPKTAPLVAITTPDNLATGAKPINSANLNALLQAALAELAHKIPATDARAALIKTLLTAAPPPASDSEATDLSAQTTKTITLNAQTTTHTTTHTTKTTTLSQQAIEQKYAGASGSSKGAPTPQTSASQALLGEQLRRLLPHQDTPNLLLSAIARLQQLPAASKLELLSPSIEQALKRIAEQIRAPEQLAQPKILAQAIKTSGIFFEQQLHASAQQPADSSKHSLINTLFTQDLKGALLTLLSRATQELNGDKQPLSTTQTLSLLQRLSSPVPPRTASPNLLGGAAQNPFTAKLELGVSLGIFMQQLMQKPAQELSDKELRTQLLVLLQQHSLHSLAKIQLQQLHNLNHTADSQDKAAPTAVWQTEIPVKQQGEVQHLHLRIEREWVNAKKEDQTNRSHHTIKQWSVTLRFDLPTLGEFCAELAIVGNQIKATLWAAQEATFSSLRNELNGLRQQLEREGIDVKSLECMRGLPPPKTLALSYSLIDIST